MKSAFIAVEDRGDDSVTIGVASTLNMAWIICDAYIAEIEARQIRLGRTDEDIQRCLTNVREGIYVREWEVDNYGFPKARHYYVTRQKD